VIAPITSGCDRVRESSGPDRCSRRIVCYRCRASTAPQPRSIKQRRAGRRAKTRGPGGSSHRPHQPWTPDRTRARLWGMAVGRRCGVEHGCRNVPEKMSTKNSTRSFVFNDNPDSVPRGGPVRQAFPGLHESHVRQASSLDTRVTLPSGFQPDTTGKSG